jgi:O-antigen/teichoic acid export membrane protein
VPVMLPTRAAIRELVGFSGHLLGFNVVNYWARNFDNLLVGRFFGPVQVGLYTRAYGLLMLPVTQVSAVFGRVMLASLSTVQDDLARTRDSYLKTLGTISCLMTPSLVALALLADDFVPVVLGPQWAPAVGMVRVFALLGIAQSLTATLGLIFVSQGRPRQMFLLSIFSAVCVIASFFVGVAIGSAYAVAVCYAIAGVIVAYPTVRVAYRMIGLPLRAVARSLAPSFLASAAMIPPIAVAHELLTHATPVVRLLTEAFVAAGTFGVAGHLLRIPAIELVVSRFNLARRRVSA